MVSNVIKWTQRFSFLEVKLARYNMQNYQWLLVITAYYNPVKWHMNLPKWSILTPAKEMSYLSCLTSTMQHGQVSFWTPACTYLLAHILTAWNSAKARSLYQYHVTSRTTKECGGQRRLRHFIALKKTPLSPHFHLNTLFLPSCFFIMVTEEEVNAASFATAWQHTQSIWCSLFFFS